MAFAPCPFPPIRLAVIACGLITCLATVTASPGRCQDASLPAAGPEGTVLVGPGVADEFDPVREAIAAARRDHDRTYRVAVVKSSGPGGGADQLLPELIDRWWKAGNSSGNGYDPATDVTILLDLGNRSIGIDLPHGVRQTAGISRQDLERVVIGETFAPKARDFDYAGGLVAAIEATEKLLADGVAAKARRAEAARVFRERTLPLTVAGVLAAGLVGSLAFLRIRHAARRAAARDKLAAFKSEVVALSDLLDAQRERHRMLPHADADFQTPMTGMTRTAYDAVQDALARYRERWLGLMDVWERADKRLGEEWALGTAASDEVIAMLDSADARPPLAEVTAACRAPLDALEQAHEKARSLLAEFDKQLAEARERLVGLAGRGRSAAAFEPTLAAVTRERELADERLESDPVAARGQLEEAAAELAAAIDRTEAVEAADDRRRLLVERIAGLHRQVATRRGEGWLLAEPGAVPEEPLATAATEAEQAASLLDAGDIETALEHLDRGEAAAAEAATLLENVAAARGRFEELVPALAARLDALTAELPEAADHMTHLQGRYAESSWDDLDENPAEAARSLDRGRTLLTEGIAEGAADRQHFFRAVATLEEAQRQAEWAAACLEAVADRRRELDTLWNTAPESRERAGRLVAALAATLARQRTDRARANERCREAQRLLETAGRVAEAARPDPRQVAQLIQAAETAAGRGEELAAEDERLARQAAADLEEAESVIRRAASWYAEGVKADVETARAQLRTARNLLERLRYEDSIRAAGESAEQARAAYAIATAEADRRRQRRLAAQRRRQLEESYRRTSRGSGPGVISLPTGGLTGPNPWRAGESIARSLGGGGGPATGGWGRDIAVGRW
jgi:uncharacterized membrane protein YgcG